MFIGNKTLTTNSPPRFILRKSWGKVEKCIRKTKNLADIGIVEVKIKMQEVVGEENECWSIKKSPYWRPLSWPREKKRSN